MVLSYQKVIGPLDKDAVAALSILSYSAAELYDKGLIVAEKGVAEVLVPIPHNLATNHSCDASEAQYGTAPAR
ncbi:hypothetical protein PsYK624_014710 [Phanerochaete sordida]|uniref:Uncharacterized protein n=1 Tax=Phanerochaete sordida TaxID=48140 RepID=A0A9P3L961_9APHY|nr:hypothetical protein PsYK624_014710 [Phanerochaete sordida]